MIEPQSAQLGASAWVWKDTFAPPRFRVNVEEPPPFPLPAALPLPLAACPFVWPLAAMTFSSSGWVFDGSAATAVALGTSASVAFDTGWAGSGVDGDWAPKAVVPGAEETGSATCGARPA